MYIDANLRKALSDRIYDKRKPAALQLELVTRRAYEAGNTKVVDGIISELSRDFAYAVRHPSYRNGGLIGLAGVAIALGHDGLPQHLDDIIQPILACFGDADARVRYYACEALYNVAKVAKGEILAYFNEIFDALCRLTADVEESARNGANLVDQLIRDIVVESASTYVFVVDRTPPNLPPAVVQPDGPEGATYQKTGAETVGPDGSDASASSAVGAPSAQAVPAERAHSFTLERFIPLLVERIYVINPATRMFLVHWIMLLDSIPELELVRYVPDFLEGLLLFLTDANKEIRTYTRTCLNMLLDEIRRVAKVRREAGTKPEGHGIDAALYRRGQDTQVYYSRVVEILLSRMDPSHEETRLVILDWLGGILEVSPNDVFQKLSSLVVVLLPATSDELPQVRTAATQLSEQILTLIPEYAGAIDAPSAVQALGRQLENEDNVTRMAALKWLTALYRVNKLSSCNEDLLQKLISPLTDPSSNVVAQDLELLGLILAASSESEFNAFFERLLDTFRQDRQLFQSAGKFICLQLCLLLDPKRVFQTFAHIIEQGANDEFESLIVQNMCNILLGATELRDFRAQLTQLHTAEGAKLFTTLFRSWRRNPAATLALCLLAQAYEHAYACLEIVARLEITVSTLVQIDKLIQSIEGPVFASLRMHLLDPWGHPYLYKTLFGMLMVLPQSQAFKILQARLQSVSGIAALPMLAPGSDKSKGTSNCPRLIDWDALLREYKEAQEGHDRAT